MTPSTELVAAIEPSILQFSKMGPFLIFTVPLKEMLLMDGTLGGHPFAWLILLGSFVVLLAYILWTER
jgi:hypothetical protein